MTIDEFIEKLPQDNKWFLSSSNRCIRRIRSNYPVCPICYLTKNPYYNFQYLIAGKELGLSNICINEIITSADNEITSSFFVPSLREKLLTRCGLNHDHRRIY